MENKMNDEELIDLISDAMIINEELKIINKEVED